MQPKILIASTTWWAMPARLALGFSEAGSEVSGLFPRGSPIAKVHSVKRQFAYSAVRPLRSLRRAIEAVRPTIIVPCDDRVVEHLHRLYEQEIAVEENSDICKLIEQSLGAPSGYPFTRQRAELLDLARLAGIRVPESAIVHDLSELRAWLHQRGLPAVLKVNGTWGGSGVRILRSMTEVETVFAELRRPRTIKTTLSHLSFHDFFPVFETARDHNPAITVQAYVEGSLSNAMFACWQGSVLDEIAVDVVFSQEELGASTVVRTTQNPEMSHAGRVLVRDLSISGFCGLDFIIEQGTGHVYLLELNPRATQLGHLEPGGRPSLITVLHRELAGEQPLVLPGFVEETIALFPQTLRCDSDNPALSDPELRHDVPWSEPDLTRELMRRSWNSRHISAFLYLAAERILKLHVENPVRKRARTFVPENPNP